MQTPDLRKQTWIALRAVTALMAVSSSASAGTLAFSGQTWTTLDNIGRNGIPTTYTSPDADTGVIGARYGGTPGDNNMWTTISLNDGDIVSFDYYLSNNDPGYTPGAEGGTYYGDWTAVFSSQPDSFAGGDWATARLFSSNGQNHQAMTLNNGQGDDYFTVSAGLETGVHVVYTFGATGYSVTATSLANPAETATDSRAYLNGNTVSDIQGFRVGLWDSEQTATLQNFTITSVPEPSAALLGFLGLAGLLRRRR